MQTHAEFLRLIISLINTKTVRKFYKLFRHYEYLFIFIGIKIFVTIDFHLA